MGHRTRLSVLSSSSRFSPRAEHFVFSFPMSTTLVVFLLLSLVADGNCSNDQDAAVWCRSLVFDSAEAINGTRLMNHVISVISVIEEDLCIIRCFMEPNCVSYNFKTAAENNGNHLCEINNSTHEGHEDDLEKDSNYTFQRAESACASSPCKNHGTCQAGFTDRGYRCLCTAGFRGHNCEISGRQSAALSTSEYSVLSPSSLIVSPATRVLSANVSSPVLQSESTSDTSVSTSVPMSVRQSVPHVASLPASLSSTIIQRASNSKRLSPSYEFLPMSQTSSHSTNMRMRTSDTASPLIWPSASQPLTRVSASLTATQSDYMSTIVSRSSSQSDPRPASVTTNVLELASSSVCGHSVLSTAASLDSSLAVLDGSNYTLSFPSVGTSNYVRIPCGMPSLKAVTICLWMKTIDATNLQTTVLSYRRGPGNGNRKIWLYLSGNEFQFRFRNGHSTYRHGQAGQAVHLRSSVTDGRWHHICVTWDNSDGSLHLYKDGTVEASWIQHRIGGYVIPGGGVLVLGQKQCSNTNQCFVVQMTGVNIWDHVINEQEIKNISSSCLSGVGNVFQWRDFKHYLRGSVAIIPSSC